MQANFTSERLKKRQLVEEIMGPQSNFESHTLIHRDQSLQNMDHIPILGYVMLFSF